MAFTTRIIPGLEGMDHVGITIRNLDEAVIFYSTLLGAKEIFRLGPFDARDFDAVDGKDWAEAHVNVKDGRFTLAMLEYGNGSRLELFQYDRPDDRREAPPKNSDLGGHHIAFKVIDLDKVLELRDLFSLRFLAGPIEITEGPAAGQRIIYVLDPWDNQLELVEYERKS
jgi:catechol 2,3-dioxygenase-like lactoylglutathione lyase family enzyme